MEVMGHPVGMVPPKCSPQGPEWGMSMEAGEEWLKSSFGSGSPGARGGTSDSHSPSDSREDLLSPLSEVIEPGAADSSYDNAASLRYFYGMPSAMTYPQDSWSVKTEAVDGARNQSGFLQQPQGVVMGSAVGNMGQPAGQLSAADKVELWRKQQQFEATLGWPWLKLDQFGLPMAGNFPFPQAPQNFPGLPPQSFPGLPPNILFAAGQQLQLQQQRQQLQQQQQQQQHQLQQQQQQQQLQLQQQQQHQLQQQQQQLQQQYRDSQNQVKEENCELMSAVAERNQQIRLGEQLAAYAGQVAGIPVDMFHPSLLQSSAHKGPTSALGEPSSSSLATDKVTSTTANSSSPATTMIARMHSAGLLAQGTKSTCDSDSLLRSQSEPVMPIVKASSELLARIKRVGNLTAEERLSKILRYRQKRIERNFKHTIKYQCRKALADTRPRVRGRFARNDDPASVPPGQTKKAMARNRDHSLDVAIAAGLKAEAERLSLQGSSHGLELEAKTEYDDMLDELQEQEVYGSFDEDGGSTELSDDNIMSIVFEDELPTMSNFMGGYGGYGGNFIGMMDTGCDLLTNDLPTLLEDA